MQVKPLKKGSAGGPYVELFLFMHSPLLNTEFNQSTAWYLCLVFYIAQNLSFPIAVHIMKLSPKQWLTLFTICALATLTGMLP